MKNNYRKIENLEILCWLWICCGFLQAEIVITELFILQADGTHTPQYIELYNNSTSSIDLTDWSITTRGSNGEFLFETFFNTNNYVDINNLEIDPFGYFLISSKWCVFSITGCNFYNGYLSDIIAEYLILPFDDTAEAWDFIDKGSIILKNNNNIEEDRIDYDIADGWPVGEESRGHSLRLHSPELNNSLSENWSLSPKTENSLWLYDDNNEIKNFGSPREENAFRLFGEENFIHIISGDINNIYNADNDYEHNNYDEGIEFSWTGTFDIETGQKYRLIIEKMNTKRAEFHGYDTVEIPNTSMSWDNIIGIDTSIIPQSLLIDQLEVADYSWTLELTKEADVIYSDRHYFTVDASDYGFYGCVDDNSCNVNSFGLPTCPTTADDDTLFSNLPSGCTPGENCFGAINFHEEANINSSTCHYVSLSIPAIVVGDANSTATVPVYLTNDSSVVIYDLEYILSFEQSENIVSFNDGSFSGTVMADIDDENISIDQAGNILVDMDLSSGEDSIFFDGSGIITYLNFNLSELEGELSNLSFLEVIVKGDILENEIYSSGLGGELIILKPNYEISGQVYYYNSSQGGEPYEIPNVELSLGKNFDGFSSEITYNTLTNVFGFYKFDLLLDGVYNLSFSKDSLNDCTGDYVSGTDISRMARHVTGNEPFNSEQIIAGDVSLDGMVSGYDISLAAQYSVDLIVNFNDLNEHWVFKPIDLQTLPDSHAELIKQNGLFSIYYKPLVLDDKIRNIYGYRLGDVNGNYCHEQLSRYKDNQPQLTNIVIDYKPIITLKLILTEPTLIEGMDIEIGFDEEVFNPLSITFNNSNKLVEHYNSLSNLSTNDKTFKSVLWGVDTPQMVEGIIGEVSFNWNNKNKSGKIWLKEFQVNDEPAIGGISLIGLSEIEVVDGVNIKNSLFPEIFSLNQNYPNPFNPQTTINWSMPKSDFVSIEIYNLKGQLIEIIFDGYKEAGTYEQVWDASTFSSGLYFCRMSLNKKTFQKIMVLLK